MKKEVFKEVAFIGLGRMGFSLALRVLQHTTFRTLAWNRSPEPKKKIARKGAIPEKTIKSMIKHMKQKRKVVWLMLPAGKVTDIYFNEVLKYLKKGDIIIDGGNSNFNDSLKRHELATKKKINFLDVGVSGGLKGLNKGFSLMVGGNKESFDFCEPLFKALSQEKGYGYMGPGGSGHYVKMVHNAIEYGMMQAIGEGFDLLKNGSFKNKINFKKVSEVWNHGSIIESFLIERTHDAFKNHNSLSKIAACIEDNGEGKWSIQEALKHDVPFSANTIALNSRFTSRDNDSFAFKIIAAIRNEFGGHKLKKK